MELFISSDLALLATRIVVGGVFLYFGLPKLRDLKSNANDFVSMGFKPGWFWGTGAALLETVGSVLLILGYWVPLLGVVFAGYMAVGTAWKILKTDKGFPDWSYDLLLLALGLVLAAYGAGIYVLV